MKLSKWGAAKAGIHLKWLIPSVADGIYAVDQLIMSDVPESNLIAQPVVILSLLQH